MTKIHYLTDFGATFGGVPYWVRWHVIHRWNRMDTGYKNMRKKVRVSGVPGALEPATRKKSPENSHFWTLGAILGGLACWVRVVSYPVGTASSLATRI